MATSALCAWCLSERGITPNETDSHGICDKHAARVQREDDARRAERKGAKKKQEVRV